MFIMNKAKTLILFFFKWFNNVLNKAAFMLWIKNDFSQISYLSIIKILVWIIEKNKDDHDQLKCFELREIEKIEIKVFNWFKKMLRVYQDWLELVNDLVEIWSRSDSDLTQIWLNTLFFSQHSFSFSTFFFFHQHLVHLHHFLFML